MPGAVLTASLDAHDAVDDPRLAADLGGDPAGLERDDAPRAGRDGQPAGTSASRGRRASPPPRDQRTRRRGRAAPMPMPTMSWNAQCAPRSTGGRSSAGTSSRPCTSASGSCVREQRQAARGSRCRSAPRRRCRSRRSCSGAPRSVSSRPSIAASFIGWCSATERAAQSPTHDLHGRRRPRPIANGSSEAEPVVAVASARAACATAYTRAVPEAGHHERGEDHVRRLRRRAPG